MPLLALQLDQYGIDYGRLLAILASYLLGSVPCGLLAGKLKGIDVRDHGSRNIGATNVLRTCGKPLGLSVFALDVLKGFLPVYAAAQLEFDTGMRISVAFAAILGHNFPVWLKFKGGKGVATSAGALLALIPIPLLAALVVWILIFFTTRYVSLASLAGAVTVPAALAALSAQRNHWDRPLLGFTLILCALVFYRHRANIGRLLKGTENRFER